MLEKVGQMPDRLLPVLTRSVHARDPVRVHGDAAGEPRRIHSFDESARLQLPVIGYWALVRNGSEHAVEVEKHGEVVLGVSNRASRVKGKFEVACISMPPFFVHWRAQAADGQKICCLAVGSNSELPQRCVADKLRHNIDRFQSAFETDEPIVRFPIFAQHSVARQWTSCFAPNVT